MPKATCPTFIVCNFDEASDFLGDPVMGPTIKHVVSIVSPGDPRPTGLEGKNVLELSFDDVTYDAKSMLHAAGYDTEAFRYPEKKDVQQLLQFAKPWGQTNDVVLVHCMAGQSRSTSSAILMAALWLGPGKEDEAVRKVWSAQQKVSPGRYFIPNALVIRHGDNLLGRKGAILSALQHLPSRLHKSAT